MSLRVTYRSALDSTAHYSAEGNGSITTYQSKFNSLNDRGELFLPGAYKETLPAFIESGFSSDSHNWGANPGGLSGAFSQQVGYISDAIEDTDGLRVTIAFHSTPFAQDVRKIAAERMAAGKTVSCSQGFSFDEFYYIYPPKYVTDLAPLLRASERDALLEYAKTFPRIRVITKAQIYEGAFVTEGSQQDATAIQMRAAQTPVLTKVLLARGTFLGEDICGSISVSAVSSLFNAFIWCCYDILFDDGEPTDNKMEEFGMAVDELSGLLKQIIPPIMSFDDVNDTDNELQGATKRAALHEFFVEPELASDNVFDHALKLSRHSELARSAVQSLCERWAKKQERLGYNRKGIQLRVGKKFSAESQKEVLGHADMIEGACSEMLDRCAQMRSMVADAAPLSEGAHAELTHKLKARLLRMRAQRVTKNLL